MPHRKFKWSKITLTCGDGEKIQDVKVLIYGDSGLCINQYDPRNPKGKFIVVTHIASGERITSGFYTSASARLFCQAICMLVDWNEVTDENIHEKYPNLGKDISFIRQLV